MKKWEKFSDEELQEIAYKSSCLGDYAKNLGYSIKGTSGNNARSSIKAMIELKQINVMHFKGYKNKSTQFNYKHVNENYNVSNLFTENSFAERKLIRRYLLAYNLIPYKCAFCGNEGEWRGKQISLELDHINGKHNDNRLENLRWLCPNCHATTPTYRGKNITYQYEQALLAQSVEHSAGQIETSPS